MTLGLVAIVVAAGVGAVVAVAARDPGVSAIGLIAALAAAAVLSDPLPPVALLGVRVVAALLAATLVRSAIVGAPRQASRLGWPGEALIGLAAFVAGVGVAGGLAAAPAAVGPGFGTGSAGDLASAVGTSAASIGAAAMLLALGVAPLIGGRPGPRLAVALLLVAQAALLARTGLAGNPGEIEEIARAALLVTCGATGAALARAVPAVQPSVATAAAGDDE